MHLPFIEMEKKIEKMEHIQEFNLSHFNLRCLLHIQVEMPNRQLDIQISGVKEKHPGWRWYLSIESV